MHSWCETWLNVQNNKLANPHDANLPPSAIPRRFQWLGMAGFGLLIAFAVALSITEHWRRSTFVLGVAMMALAVVRVYCDSQVLGVFAVRSRRFDAIFSATLGTIMLFLALSVDSLGS